MESCNSCIATSVAKSKRQLSMDNLPQLPEQIIAPNFTRLRDLPSFITVTSNQKVFTFTSPLTSGTVLTHGLGTKLSATMSQYYLECRAFDTDGNIVSGITCAEITDNTASVTFNDVTFAFVGTIILTANLI